MSGGWINVGTQSSRGYSPEDLYELLEAAEELELHHNVEHGHVLRELTRILRKQCTFAALKREYDCRS